MKKVTIYESDGDVITLTARAAKRGAAGDGVDISDLTRRIEAIERQAARRKSK